MKKFNLKEQNTTIILYFFIGITVSCSGSEIKKEEKKELTPVTQKLSKPPGSYTDTLVINTKVAVFYNPDSIQLEKIKAVNKPGVFESMTHDCFYQMRNARLVLEKYWPGVKIIETSKARFLLFIKTSKSKSWIDLDTKNDMCGIILFDCKQDPVLIDMMNIDTALEFYFNKK